MDVFKLIEKHGIELHGDIEYFAELIRQDERAACEKACEEFYTIEGIAQKCAAAIRARSKHD